MTDVLLKLRLAETTRQYQAALETRRRIRHECDLRMTPIEAAPLLAEVDAEVAEREQAMNEAFALARGPGCSVMGDK
jgi:hypothetical protein